MFFTFILVYVEIFIMNIDVPGVLVLPHSTYKFMRFLREAKKVNEIWG